MVDAQLLREAEDILWDLTDPDQDIEAYFIVRNSEGNRFVFAPTKKKDKRLIRAFLSEEDAKKHLSLYKDDKCYVKKVSIMDAMVIFEASARGSFQSLEDVEIHLSGYDAKGQCFSLEKMWSFFQN